MRNERRLRRLTVDDTTWLWSVRHRCGEECREVLSLHRSSTGTTLRIVFRAGPGRFVGVSMQDTGSVSDGDHALNLHRPGTVRLLLDEATAHGDLPVSRGEHEIDGWPLFTALMARGHSSSASDPKPPLP